MVKTDERFEIVYREGSAMREEGVRMILVDRQTGVQYLCWKTGYGAGITPLLDAEGRPVAKQVE